MEGGDLVLGGTVVVTGRSRWLSNPRLWWGTGPEQPCSQAKPWCRAASCKPLERGFC